MGDPQLAKVIYDSLVSPSELDRNLESANVVDGLFAIARSINRLADAMIQLGNGDATTSYGAIEALSMKIGDGFSLLSSAISDLDINK